MNTGGREVRVFLRDVTKVFLVKASWNPALDQLPFTATNAFYIRSADCTTNELLEVVYGIAKGQIGAAQVMGGIVIWFEDDLDAATVKMFLS